jgi:hypothetical protein
MKTTETILELLSSKSIVAKVKDWLQKNNDKTRYALARFGSYAGHSILPII